MAWWWFSSGVQLGQRYNSHVDDRGGKKLPSPSAPLGGDMPLWARLHRHSLTQLSFYRIATEHCFEECRLTSWISEKKKTKGFFFSSGEFSQPAESVWVQTVFWSNSLAIKTKKAGDSPADTRRRSNGDMSVLQVNPSSFNAPVFHTQVQKKETFSYFFLKFI